MPGHQSAAKACADKAGAAVLRTILDAIAAAAEDHPDCLGVCIRSFALGLGVSAVDPTLAVQVYQALHLDEQEQAALLLAAQGALAAGR